jgi:hypothetical protein
MATRPQALRRQLRVASRARDPFEEVPKPKALHVTEIARLVALDGPKGKLCHSFGGCSAQIVCWDCRQPTCDQPKNTGLGPLGTTRDDSPLLPCCSLASSSLPRRLGNRVCKLKFQSSNHCMRRGSPPQDVLNIFQIPSIKIGQCIDPYLGPLGMQNCQNWEVEGPAASSDFKGVAQICAPNDPKWFEVS